MVALASDEASLNKEHDHPRLMIVSSITGLLAGLPAAAAYGATKAFSVSLARALSLELESAGVSVTLLCPGATRTNFATVGKLERAVVWDLPLGVVMEAKDVAQQGVDAMMYGEEQRVPGILNRLLVDLAHSVLPDRFTMRFAQFTWNPWPKQIAFLGELLSGQESSTTTQTSDSEADL
eukprot:CAMPEP_0194056260 /NCGR_PEP_ID=MMETSP0009_2-20130614/59525_1 /TAXON_ID=210454 /ORGANISM="Grammatophora oceanica, Strain CCMP 410" /LENGTH=178 /DNA_ID=CAMNT_0038705563 /DNA_START=51 /DNA_END=587 /DNA_ORIENTATION=-